MSVSAAALEKEVAELEAKVTAATAAHEEAAAQLEQRRARLRECDAEISGLAKEREELNRQLTDCNVERKKLEHKSVPDAGFFLVIDWRSWGSA